MDLLVRFQSSLTFEHPYLFRSREYFSHYRGINTFLANTAFGSAIIFDASKQQGVYPCVQG